MRERRHLVSSAVLFVLSQGSAACGPPAPAPLLTPRPAATTAPSTAATAAPALPEPTGPIAGLGASCVALRGGSTRCWAPLPGLEGARGLRSLASDRGVTWAVDAAGAPRCAGCAGGVPASLAALGPLVEITAGATVIRDARGGVWRYLPADCRSNDWGWSSCEEGNSFSPPPPVGPVAVPEAQGAVAVAGAWSHSCAVLRSGRVVCWGKNLLGEIGAGHSGNELPPREIPDLDDAVDIAAGIAHTCAVRRTGRVTCWGSGEGGALGARAAHAFARVDVPGIDDAASIAANPRTHTTCVVRRSGRLSCFGRSPALAVPAAESGPVDVGLDGVERVSVGESVACAASRDGAVRCFGDQAGATLETVPLPAKATAVGAGAGRTCALTGEGDLLCWGAWFDLSGDAAEEVPVRTPRPIHDIHDAVRLTVGKSLFGEHDGCVVRRGGEVVCWRGTEVAQPGVHDAISVALAEDFACALRKSGAVSCWGVDHRGHPGRDGSYGSTAAYPIAEIKGARALAAGYHAACFLDRAAAVRCWGGHETDLFATGAANEDTPPKLVPQLAGALDFAFGPTHACARLPGSRAACWGKNTSGEVAPGSSVAFPGPVVSPLTDIERVFAGESRTCVQRAGGKLTCWGSPPDDSMAALLPPGKEIAPGDLTDLTIGTSHACVLRPSGDVACFGDDEKGQLGRGGGPFGIHQVLAAEPAR